MEKLEILQVRLGCLQRWQSNKNYNVLSKEDIDKRIDYTSQEIREIIKYILKNG